MALHLIARLSDIPPGEGRSFIVGSSEVAVFHTRSAGVFATQAHCPHKGGPLADGLTDGANVVCPLHERIYSLATGEGIGNECSVKVYPVSVAEDGIYLELDAAS